MQLLKHYFYIQKSIFPTHWYKRKVQESYSVLWTLQNMITHKYLLANSSGVKHTVMYDRSQWRLFHCACKAWTMFRPGPGGRAQPSGPWWPCSRQYSCFRWVTMLSLISGIEICRRTLPLSKDRVLSPENISVIMRATTGMTCGTEDQYESSNQTPTHKKRLDCRKWRAGPEQVLLMLVTSFQLSGPITWDISHLDHDKFPLPGPPIGPLLSKTQADFKMRQTWCLATLVGYHTCTTHKHVY